MQQVVVIKYRTERKWQRKVSQCKLKPVCINSSFMTLEPIKLQMNHPYLSCFLLFCAFSFQFPCFLEIEIAISFNRNQNLVLQCIRRKVTSNHPTILYVTYIQLIFKKSD